MLDFYFIVPGLSLGYYDKKHFVGGLTLEDTKWLHEKGIVKPFENNTYNSLEVESIPFFDDFQLPIQTLKTMNSRLQMNKKNLILAELQSESLIRYTKILETSIKANRGLQAICD